MNNLQTDLYNPWIGLLTDTTTSDQSELGSNGDEGSHHTPQISRTGTTQSDAV